MTIISSILNFIANKIGNVSMGTSATTLTGAIAEVNRKSNTVIRRNWSGVEPVTGRTNVLTAFDVTAGKYLVFAKNGNGLASGAGVSSVNIRVQSGTTTVAINGDDSNNVGQSNWANASAYYEFSTSGTIIVSCYGKNGTDPILRGDAICVKLI